jgi:hypothetical protein
VPALGGSLEVTVAALLLLWTPRPKPAPISPPPPRPWVTQESVHRIKSGMSRAEVEAILGPPGDYTTRPVSCFSLRPGVGLSRRVSGRKLVPGSIGRMTSGQRRRASAHTEP